MEDKLVSPGLSSWCYVLNRAGCKAADGWKIYWNTDILKGEQLLAFVLLISSPFIFVEVEDFDTDIN